MEYVYYFLFFEETILFVSYLVETEVKTLKTFVFHLKLEAFPHSLHIFLSYTLQSPIPERSQFDKRAIKLQLTLTSKTQLLTVMKIPLKKQSLNFVMVFFVVDGECYTYFINKNSLSKVNFEGGFRTSKRIDFVSGLII